MGKIGKMWEETVKQHGKNNQQKWGENHGKTGEHLDNFLGKDTV
jgi:hypothetical protein